MSRTPPQQYTYVILLVDPSKVFQQILEALLEDTPFRVQTANTGKEALQLLRQDYYIMVCSAMHLADMDGLELCRHSHAMAGLSHKPFVLLTTEDIPNLAETALPAGVTDVFHKHRLGELAHFIRRYPFQANGLAGRVLFIEDSASQRAALAALFRSHGLIVDDYASAEQACQALDAADYDVVVTDVVLDDGMSGLVLVNRIRRRADDKGDIPVLAITAFDDDARRVELYHMGVDDYVTKPVIEMELMARLRNLILRRQLWRQLSQQKALAQQASAAKSDFLAAMSHELRTPLSGILGFCELLDTDDEEPLSPHQRNSVQVINSSGQHLLQLIDDLLDLSKIEARVINLRMQPVAVASVLADCLKLTRRDAELRGIRIDPRLGNPQQRVLADPLRLRQALLNLISNAVKYNRPAGCVTVTVVPADDAWLEIAIEDTGLGIPPDRQASVFQPFSRLPAHRSIAGTGLGLAITKNLVELMGGTLTLASELGQGSRFTLRLPRSPAAAPVVPATQESCPPASPSFT